MANSKILLAPFPRTIALEVACPIKLLEYMALGKPMVLDNVGELPELLRVNNAALVSDPENVAEFINNIRLILRDDKLRREIAANAKNLSSEYTWQKQIDKLNDLYNCII